MDEIRGNANGMESEKNIDGKIRNANAPRKKAFDKKA